MNINADLIIKKDFRSFVRKAFQFQHNGESLGQQPYIDYLCHELERVIDGEIRKLLINLPPRHLKTFLGAVCLSAWTLAQNPATKIIVVTCGDNLAQDIAFAIRSIMQSKWYQRIFETRLHKDRMRVCDFQTTKGGGVYAVSAESNITGRGADLIIFDDPLDIKDANNLDQIERVNQSYDTLITSRLNNPRTGKLVIIAHRLNECDLSGHVLELGGWYHAVLPLVAPRSRVYELGFDVWHREKNEVLRPDAYSKEAIEKLRTSTINPDFETFYQQAVGGTQIRIQREHFNLVSMLDHRRLPVVLSVDAGQRRGPSSSYSVIQAWVEVDGNNHVLLDQWRQQCGYRELQSAFWQFARRFRLAACVIEDTANGSALIEETRGNRRSLLKVAPIIPDGRSKTARLVGCINVIQGGHIWLPANAAWLETYIAEFVAFPRGRNDDQVDATTQYLDWISTQLKMTLPPKRIIGVFVNNRGPWARQF